MICSIGSKLLAIPLGGSEVQASGTQRSRLKRIRFFGLGKRYCMWTHMVSMDSNHYKVNQSYLKSKANVALIYSSRVRY